MTYREVGYMDERGKIHQQERSAGWGCFWTALVAASCLALGILVAPRLPEQFWAWMYPQAGKAAPALLPTAAVVFSQPAPRQEQAPASAPVFADATPYDNQAYNATAQASQQEPPAASVPVGDVYIIEATPTALPEPGQPGFESSFAEPVCSPMIDYLRGHPCYGRVGQKPLPQPGDSDFAASFEEPGD